MTTTTEAECMLSTTSPATLSSDSLAILPQTLTFLRLSPSGALYLPLPTPHSHIILTGPDSPSDTTNIVKAFNDPLIYRWTVGTPFPYLLEHAQDTLKKTVKTYETTVARMCKLASGDQEEEIKVDQTPLRFIREIQLDGSWLFIGDIGLLRDSFLEVLPLEERAKLVEANNARCIGDPEIVWMIGDYLTSSHHGQGIMTSVIRTVLYTWAVPLMNCRTVRAYIITENWGSKRVFEKLGFTLTSTIEGGVPLQGKREKEHGTWVMEWKYNSI
ncbi:hypothetical protein CALCODRAFT_503218 [Calocera cornea HHB12733]|uniref:N-acetyltransferase domain-containing protein n=1 Tax=Calocera cornea HHB12733 TaxID=1353952 RepID=A0A165CYS1_9BASI|nr:hypothetical protein CALCODRAFT_503218 [Calocera cornea HHB12733]